MMRDQQSRDSTSDGRRRRGLRMAILAIDGVAEQTRLRCQRRRAANIGVRAVLARMPNNAGAGGRAGKAAGAGVDGRIVERVGMGGGDADRDFLDNFSLRIGGEPPCARIGQPGRVRVREPWALHLLTSDGTNARPDNIRREGARQPVLVRLTPVCLVLKMNGMSAGS